MSKHKTAQGLIWSQEAEDELLLQEGRKGAFANYHFV